MRCQANFSMLLKRLYHRLSEGQRQFLTFGLAGGIAFLVDTGILALLTRVFGFDPIGSRLISFTCGLTTTWLINRNLTFRDRRKQPLWLEYLRYFAVNGFGGLLNFGVYAVLVKNSLFIARFPELGVAVGVLVGLGFNFTGSKYLVYRRNASRH
jgi:putative flippase GtrA